jgi:hypothetical protein
VQRRGFGQLGDEGPAHHRYVQTPEVELDAGAAPLKQKTMRVLR